MPRYTSFGPARATSIDLCVRDFVAHSRHRAGTRILCDPVEAVFEGFDLEPTPKAGAGGHLLKAWRLAGQIRRRPTDLVVVQQHLPTAFVIASRVKAPVLFHSHNYQKRSANPARRALRAWRYSALKGLVLVSQSCVDAFERDWPGVGTPRAVVHNGLDMRDWTPAPVRDKRIVVVARAAPEKGVLEAMRALAEALPKAPGWTAQFMLSEGRRNPDYFAEAAAIAARFPGQIELLESQPHSAVKAAYESAAIALVLSRWNEPFGRTALEAQAGGAALISSGSGGLAEISGPTALMVDPDNHAAVVAALMALISDDERRTRLGREGRERVAALFDIRVVSSWLDDIYEAVARAGPLPPPPTIPGPR